MSEAESASRVTEVGTVGVPVRDQNEALDFYVRNLGFEKAPGCPDGANNLFPPAVYFRWSRSSLDPTISQTKENA